MNQVLVAVSLLCLMILLLIVLLKKFSQPYMIAYIMAGFLIGPHGAGLFPQADTIESVAEIGILLLMFFLGMEIQIPDRRSLLFRPPVAQGMKILLTVVVVLAAAAVTGWPMKTSFIIFTLLIFNSTAVVSEYLRRNNELHTEFGIMILNILLLQDLMLAPVLTAFQFLTESSLSRPRVAVSLAASVLIFFLLRSIRNRDLIQLHLKRLTDGDHELQVFACCLLCLGFGLLAELCGLSGAVGSFVAGILIGRLEVFNWLEKALHPFKVFFVALFFVSVGLRLDPEYILAHLSSIALGTILALLVNSLLSALVFRALDCSWSDSFYGGALLSQIGECGILACSLAYRMEVISRDLFKTGIAITALSLLVSTLWVSALRKIITLKKE